MRQPRAHVLGVPATAVVAWVVAARFDFYDHVHLSDLPIYETATRAFLDGGVPYRDVPFEYPPGAALLLTLARLVPLSYSTAFSVLMLVALCATVIGTMATARALGHGPRREVGAGLVVALVPILLGDFVATRFDLVVAALLAWTFWAAVSRRFGWMWALLAAGVVVKLAPIALVPLLAVWHHHHHGSRALVRAGGRAAAGVGATFLPFLVFTPSGVWDLLTYHIDRPLQIESLGGSYLLGLHALADIGLRVETSFGSQNVAGDGARAIAAISTSFAIVAVIAIALLVAFLLQRPGINPAHTLAAGVAATLTVAIVGAKVLSPQFVVWLVPVTLLVSGRFGRTAFALTVAVLVATQTYFPVRYLELVALEPRPIALLVIRNALLVGLVAAVWPRFTTRAAADARATRSGLPAHPNPP